jgi:diacylglycerol kinase (ATP)
VPDQGAILLIMNTPLQVVKKILYSTKYSLDGIHALWFKEQSFRLEIYGCMIALPLALYLPFAPIYKLILILLMLLLLTTEILNSAIEVVVDRISMEVHPQSKIAKDLGCASVTMIVLMNAIAWIFAISSII